VPANRGLRGRFANIYDVVALHVRAWRGKWHNALIQLSAVRAWSVAIVNRRGKRIAVVIRIVVYLGELGK
jgi:hypothetical protein